MINDPKSSLILAESHASKSWTAAANNGASVDHANAGSVSFFISVGTVGASGTIDAKTQYSEDNSTWTDYTADGSGNDLAIAQIKAAGTAQLNVPNPIARYTRVVMTTAVAASVVGVVSVLGPLRHVAA